MQKLCQSLSCVRDRRNPIRELIPKSLLNEVALLQDDLIDNPFFQCQFYLKEPVIVNRIWGANTVGDKWINAENWTIFNNHLTTNIFVRKASTGSDTNQALWINCTNSSMITADIVQEALDSANALTEMNITKEDVGLCFVTTSSNVLLHNRIMPFSVSIECSDGGVITKKFTEEVASTVWATDIEFNSLIRKYGLKGGLL